MIKTMHQVVLVRGGRERVITETDDLRVARLRDSQLDMAASLLVEAERLFTEGKVHLPKELSFASLEQTLEDLFIAFAEDSEGMKRAMKGQQFTDPSDEPNKPPSRGGRKKATP